MKLLRFRLFLIALLLIIVSPIWGEKVSDLPIGQRAVIDSAQVLSQPELVQLENQMQQMYATNAIQPAVVVVKTTDGQAIFDYAMAIFNRWQLGDKQKNNGLLMVVAVEDRAYHTVTGYGLEGELADAYLAKIQRQYLVPAFRQQQYAQGISEVFREIENRMALPVTERQQLFAQESAIKENGEMRGDALCIVAFLLSLFIPWLHANKVVGDSTRAVLCIILIGGSIVSSLFLWWLKLNDPEIEYLWGFLGCFVIFLIIHLIAFGFFSLFRRNSASSGNSSSGGSSSDSSSSSSYSSGGGGGYSGGGGRSGGGGAGGRW